MAYIREFFTFIIDKLFELTNVIGFPSYALAVIMIAIIIKVILYPLTLKQMRSTLGMQEIQPKMQELQKMLFKINVYGVNFLIVALLAVIPVDGEPLLNISSQLFHYGGRKKWQSYRIVIYLSA